MNILDLTSEELVKYVEEQFKAVVDSCLVVIDDDCDWRSHEIIMYRRNPGDDWWDVTTVERNY